MSKKILIVDDSKSTTNLLELLLTKFSDSTVEIENDYEIITQKYTPDEYDFIIFDHNCKVSDALMNHILTQNPSQKCILLSDSLSCPVNCDFCSETFRFVRLLKPIEPKDILYYIDEKNNFACPNKNVFDNVNTLEKLYDFINLEENVYFTKKEINDDKIVISSSLGSSLRINEMDKIEDNINEKYFSFNVMTNNNIEISYLS